MSRVNKKKRKRLGSEREIKNGITLKELLELWYADELRDFSKEIGLFPYGTKEENAKRILKFLEENTIKPIPKAQTKEKELNNQIE